MNKIVGIAAREIIDSRANPTIEAEVYLDCGISGIASVPSGASTGSNEALELRDGDDSRYCGNGVLNAIKNIHQKISPLLCGVEVGNQRLIDQLMISEDNTDDKSNFGANAMLAVSLAAAHAAANLYEQPLYRYLGGVDSCRLPLPMMNIVNGGRHSNSPIAFQEFMIMPNGADSFEQALRMGVEVFHALKDLLKQNRLSTSVGDEGGFAPEFKTKEQAFDFILEAIENANYRPGKDISLALDCAASEFFEDGFYNYSKFEGHAGAKINPLEQIDYLKSLTDKYPIISIEDPLGEDDWANWRLLTETIGDKVQIVGDDLFVTNQKFLQRGIKEKSANAILIKLNQIGTLTETLDVIELAQKNKFNAIISHRSGETEDTTIADLAVAVNSGFIKCGSVSRSERLAKYNRLLKIESELLDTAEFGKI